MFATFVTFRFLFAYLKHTPKRLFRQEFFSAKLYIRPTWTHLWTRFRPTAINDKPPARPALPRLLDWCRLDIEPKDSTPVLEARDIVKDFGGTRALDHVNFTARRGEVHAVLGENGAGKSTLMKVLCGALQPDHGTLHLDGRQVRFGNPHEALESGVSIVHQQFTLVPELSVAENVFLGRPHRTTLGLIDWPTLRSEATRLLARLGFDLDPRIQVKQLGAGDRRIVEIARALAVSAKGPIAKNLIKVLIMDEPSAVLGPSEMERLFEIIRRLKSEGTTILYISHRLEEIFTIADRVTVLRDGRLAGDFEIDEKVDREFLVSKMVGRQWSEQVPDKPDSHGRELLRVDNLTREGVFENVSFTLHAGEIVGLAGLVGSGRTDVCKTIIGATRPGAGSIQVDGKPVEIKSPREALAHGIAYLPEDRSGEGVVGCRSVGENITLAIVKHFAKAGVLSDKRENQFVAEMMQKTDIRASGPQQTVASLSGGNQQKVALAKWLSTQARIFLLDKPTAGIDVGAKREIYRMIADLARSGAAVLLVSSEIPEILSMSTRILVMSQGRIVSQQGSEEATEESVLSAAII